MSFGFARLAAVFVAAIAGIMFVEWPFILHNRASADTIEPFIQIALLQSWSNCLTGFGNCLSPAFYYPATHTLGYNDGYLISGLLYHSFRVLGLDPIAAYEGVSICIRLIGFGALIVLGHRFLSLPFWAALLAGWLSLISINLVNQIVHTQLLYAAFVPLGLVLILVLLRQIENLGNASDQSRARRAVLAALGLGVFAAAWSITAFYSFFCFALLVVFMAIGVAVLRWRQMKGLIANLIRHPTVGVAVGSGALLTPAALLLVYGATARETGGHPWIAFLNPRLQDLLNVGPANIWTPALDPIYRIFAGTNMSYEELATGVPPLFFLCALAGALMVLRSKRSSDTQVVNDPATLMAVLLIAASLLIVTVLRIGNGYSLFYLVWKIVPGASAIRVPSRFLIFLTPIFCLAVAYFCARLLAEIRARLWVRRTALGLVIVLLTIEQFNYAPPFYLDRAHEVAFLDEIPGAPPTCRAFYITVPRYPASGQAVFDRNYAHAADAILISALHRLPTVNGVASFKPQAWDLDAPFEPDYEDRVRRYAERHKLTGSLCGLNLQTKRWSLPQPRASSNS